MSTPTIGFVGFGEAPRCFCRHLVQEHAVDVLAFCDGITQRARCRAIGVSGTLFGYARTPAEIVAYAWFTAFFLRNGSTSIYTLTPELYPTAIPSLASARHPGHDLAAEAMTPLAAVP